MKTVVLLFIVLSFIANTTTGQNVKSPAPYVALDTIPLFHVDTTCNCANWGALSFNQTLRINEVYEYAIFWEWEFTQTSPVLGEPWIYRSSSNDIRINQEFDLYSIEVKGNVLSEGATYNVRVRPILDNNRIGRFGSVECIQTQSGTGSSAFFGKENPYFIRNAELKGGLNIPWQGIVNHVTSDSLQFIFHGEALDKITIEIYDLHYNLLLNYNATINHQDGNKLVELDLPSKTSGIYVAIMSLNDKFWTDKFLVQP